MSRFYTDIGDKYGRWVVIKDLGTVRDNGVSKSCVLVKCECGVERQLFLHILKNGISKSCGCLKKEEQSKRRKKFAKHNLSKHPLFQIWRGMRSRCFNKKDKAYPDYGARGISLCEEWEKDFKPFYDWAINNGWEKGLINDRRDNDMGYSPDNCRFVTPPISTRNTRRNVNIEFNGVTKCITDWAKYLNISLAALKKRIKNWGIERALSTPKKLK